MTELQAFADYITKNEDLTGQLINKVKYKLFDRFITAPNKERAEISSILNSLDMVMDEIRAVYNSTSIDIN